jgi:hypothetical protein
MTLVTLVWDHTTPWKCKQATIEYLVNQHAQKNLIGTGSFLQRINMQDPACGFIKDKNQQFVDVHWEIDSEH